MKTLATKHRLRVGLRSEIQLYYSSKIKSLG